MAQARHVHWQNDAYYSQRKNSIARLSVPLSPNSCLLEASKDGKTARVGSLLARGASVSAKTTGEMTALHFASEAGHKETVAYLLLYGANVHAKNDKGQTALFLSCAKSHLEVVQLLLKNGASVNTKDNSNETPLHALMGNTECPRFRKIETLQCLLNYNADRDARDSRGRTVLHWACSYAEVGMAILLVRNHANVNVMDSSKETPLHIAARHEQDATRNGGRMTDLVDHLLRSGARVDQRNINGNTPLHFAAMYGSLEVTRLLLGCTQNVNAPNCEMETPLHYAAKYKNGDVCNALIFAGADMNLRNNDGVACSELLKKANISLKKRWCGQVPDLYRPVPVNIDISIENPFSSVPVNKDISIENPFSSVPTKPGNIELVPEKPENLEDKKVFTSTLLLWINSTNRIAAPTKPGILEHRPFPTNPGNLEHKPVPTKPESLEPVLETEVTPPPEFWNHMRDYFQENNLNPVKISLMIQKMPEFLNESKQVCKFLDTAVAEMMNEKDSDEAIAIKFHYLRHILQAASQSAAENEGSLEPWLNKLLQVRQEDMCQENMESFIRASMNDFPFTESTLHRQIVEELAKAEISHDPAAVVIINRVMNGEQTPPDNPPCSCCGDYGENKRCAKCKMTQYCSKDCQKLHWFTHKSYCKKLAASKKPKPDKPNENVPVSNVKPEHHEDHNGIHYTPVHLKPADPDFVSEVLSNPEDYYKMSAMPRGKAVIICNGQYQQPNTSLAGPAIDAVNLNNLFRALGFQTEVLKDLTAEQIVNVVEQERKSDFHKRADAFIFHFSGHGGEINCGCHDGENHSSECHGEKVICGIDGKDIKVNSGIIEKFDGHNCRRLLGKPKLFFIAACRGGRRGEGVVPSDPADSGLDDSMEHEMISRSIKIQPKQSTHVEADILKVCSTLPGYVSYETQTHGCRFVVELIEGMNKYAHRLEIGPLLTKVNSRVNAGHSLKDKQLSEYTSRLTKWLHLLPEQYNP